MANPSLEQLHQISQQNLEKIHFKLVHSSAILHLLAFWLEESHSTGAKEVGLHSIVWLLTDLLEEAITFLPEV